MSDSEEKLPQATHSEIMAIAGFKLTVCNLDNGQRVIEDNDEFRRLMAWFGLNPDAIPKMIDHDEVQP